MKYNDRQIKTAMDNRLSFLRGDARSRVSIWNRILEAESMPKRREKSLGFVLVFATMIVLACVAVAASLNLFQYFGQKDQRIEAIIPDVVVNTDQPVQVSREEQLTEASINSAYYDGQTLMVLYVIENGTHTESFVPSKELLSKMHIDNDYDGFEVSTTEEEVINAAFRQARANGEPYGYMRYSVSPSDHTMTDSGIDIPYVQEREERIEDGMRIMLREYRTPLPQAVEDQEVLHLEMMLRQSTTYVYFDGQNCYTLYEKDHDGEAIRMTVYKANAQMRQYSGEGTYLDERVSIAGTLSPTQGCLTVVADRDVFTALDNKSWYTVIIMDEHGNSYTLDTCKVETPQSLRVAFEGNGLVPEQLAIYMLVQSEGAWDEAQALQDAVPIMLQKK